MSRLTWAFLGTGSVLVLAWLVALLVVVGPIGMLDSPTSGGGHEDEETGPVTMADEETGASVVVTGVHDTDAVSMTVEAADADAPARSGPVISVTTRSPFDRLEVRLPLLEDRENASELRVYHWRGTGDDTWTAVETSVEKGYAVATVTSAGYFTVRHPEDWADATSATGELDDDMVVYSDEDTATPDDDTGDGTPTHDTVTERGTVTPGNETG